MNAYALLSLSFDERLTKPVDIKSNQCLLYLVTCVVWRENTSGYGVELYCRHCYYFLPCYQNQEHCIKFYG